MRQPYLRLRDEAQVAVCESQSDGVEDAHIQREGLHRVRPIIHSQTRWKEGLVFSRHEPDQCPYQE